MIAAVRVLWLATRRELKGLSSVGLNNLVFSMLFLMQGSNTKRGAFLNTLLFQIVLFVPLLFAMSADALERVPREREMLWPLTAWQRMGLRVTGVGLNPAFWLLGVGVAGWGGVWAGAGFVVLAVLVQVVVGLVSLMRRGGGSAEPARWLPRFPGRLGGVVQVEARHIFRTLDFCAALLLCVMGGAYRAFSKGPQVEAFPILAILVAIALSTYAQRSFGLDGAGGIARYRLLPVPGWRLLLAKDAAYLGVVGLLVLPLGFVPGMTFGLMAVAIGRYPAVRLPVRQRAWRFTGGDVRFGLAQLVVGGLMGIGSAQIGVVFLAVAVVVYGGSVFLGGRWWDRG